MSSGGGQSGETRYNWNEDMGPRWNSLLNTAPWLTGFQMNQQGNIVGLNDRQQYTGERFAPMTADQYESGGYIREMNRQSSNPVGAMNAARSGIEGTLGGDYLTGDKRNLYAQMFNPAAEQNTSTDRNLFAGDSPYFRTALMNGMDDITGAYQRGTAADTTRMFNLSGAFGGSAHQDAVANNEAALGKNLSNFASGMINDQFNRSAGLEDSFLSRDLQNQQFNKAGALNAYESMFGRGSAAHEGERARQMQAIGAGQAENGLALDRGNALMNVGNMFQQNDQRNRDFQFDQWNQTQNYPWTVLQNMAGLYGQAMGGGAGLSRSVYDGGGSSPWLSAGLLAASMLG